MLDMHGLMLDKLMFFTFLAFSINIKVNLHPYRMPFCKLLLFLQVYNLTADTWMGCAAET